MKLPASIKIFAPIVVFLLISFSTSNVLAVSSMNASKVKDFKLTVSSGRALRRSDVSLAVRRYYRGVRPRIVKREMLGKPNCYHVKFLYKNQLKRVSFNCTATRLAMRGKH